MRTKKTTTAIAVRAAAVAAVAAGLLLSGIAARGHAVPAEGLPEHTGACGGQTTTGDDCNEWPVH